MLRDPLAKHEGKRSKHLLKYKPVDTAEAEVFGYEPGLGRNKDRLGALVCRWNGKVFNIGTGLSDELRDNPPQLGQMVTFQYNGVTDAGIPRFPVFIIERDYEGDPR